MQRLLNVTTWLISFLLLGAMLALSVRGILDPHAAAQSFGVGLSTQEAELYQIVYRSRNFILAAAGLSFLFAGMWRALAIMTTLSLALPAFDIWALRAAEIPIAAVHPATLIALAILAGLLWLKLRVTGGAARVA